MEIIYAAILWLLLAPVLALIVGRCIRSMSDPAGALDSNGAVSSAAEGVAHAQR
jgi:hypothetical protein